MKTVIGFNTTTPPGRAVAHLFDRSALARYRDRGWTELEYAGGGRQITVDTETADQFSAGEKSLLILAESLAGAGSVNVNWLLSDTDDDQHRVIAETMWIAAGFALLGVVA